MLHLPIVAAAAVGKIVLGKVLFAHGASAVTGTAAAHLGTHAGTIAGNALWAHAPGLAATPVIATHTATATTATAAASNSALNDFVGTAIVAAGVVVPGKKLISAAIDTIPGVKEGTRAGSRRD